MANVRDIRKRIRSVKSTQQITKAMKMVAAAKLRRAQERAVAARPYNRGMGEVLKRVAGRADAAKHTLLAARDSGFVVVVVVTADRGLCGGFNQNALKAATRMMKEAEARGEDARLYVIGRKAREYFRRRPYKVIKEKLNVFANLAFGHAVTIGNELMELFLSGGAREVRVVGNRFRSLLTQEIHEFPLLPVPRVAQVQGAAESDYIYEPDPDRILEKLLPLHVHLQVYHALMESSAAEHAARMMAMENATKNAGEMIEKLTLTMNKIRQASITRELIEVVSGASAQSESS